MEGFRQRAPHTAPQDTLTPREREIIQCVLEGMNTVETAKALRIARQTVRNRLRSIYDKTGMNNLRELRCKYCTEKRSSQPSAVSRQRTDLLKADG